MKSVPLAILASSIVVILASSITAAMRVRNVRAKPACN
jgi:hypothetical protein